MKCFRWKLSGIFAYQQEPMKKGRKINEEKGKEKRKGKGNGKEKDNRKGEK